MYKSVVKRVLDFLLALAGTIVLLPLLEFVNVVSSEITSFDSTIMVMIANGTATMPATMPMAPADW